MANVTAGAGATVNAPTIEGQLWQLSHLINNIVFWQNTTAKNPKTLTNCTLSLDFNALQYSGRIILPYTSTIGSNGTVVETATEWLL